MFERTLEFLWKRVWPRPREMCAKPEQLCVTFIAGYIGTVGVALSPFTVPVCSRCVLRGGVASVRHDRVEAEPAEGLELPPDRTLSRMDRRLARMLML